MATWATGNVLSGTLAVLLLTLEAVRAGEWLRLYRKHEEDEKIWACDLAHWPVLNLPNWMYDGSRAYTVVSVPDPVNNKDNPLYVPNYETTVGDYRFTMKFHSFWGGSDPQHVVYTLKGWKYEMSQGCEERETTDIFLKDENGNPHVRFTEAPDD